VSRTSLALVALAIVAAAVASCDDPNSNRDVGSPPECAAIDVSLFLPPQITSAPLTIRGTATTSGGDAIENLIIDGHAATSDSFNFRTFSVSLEQSDVLDLHRVPSEPLTGEAGNAGMSGSPSSQAAATGDVVQVPVLVVLTTGKICALPPGRFTSELALTAQVGGGGGPSSSAGASSGGATAAGSGGSTDSGGSSEGGSSSLGGAANGGDQNSGEAGASGANG
jgi:hypothetical protein